MNEARLELVHTYVDQSGPACSTWLVERFWPGMLSSGRLFPSLTWRKPAAVLPGRCAVPLALLLPLYPFAATRLFSFSSCLFFLFFFVCLFVCKKWPPLFPGLACSLHLSFYHCVSWLCLCPFTPSQGNSLSRLGCFGGFRGVKPRTLTLARSLPRSLARCVGPSLSSRTCPCCW